MRRLAQARGPLRLLALAGAIAVAFGCVTMLVVLARDVGQKVEQLATANSDSVQWSTSQADVELLALLVEIQLAERNGGDLTQLRRRYDVFYGRVRLLQEGPFYQQLREQPVFAERLAAAAGFLDIASPLIDGSDAQLHAVMPQLLAEAEAIRPVLRDLTMQSQRAMAAGSDARRETARQTLAQTLQVMLVLVAVLVGLIFALAWLVREARRQTAAQARANNRLEAIISTSLDGILVLDTGLRVINANAAARGLFGLGETPVTGVPLSRLLIGAVARLRIGSQLAASGPGPHRITGQRADGSEFPAEFTVGLAEAETDQTCVLFVRDISDRLAAEAALVDARDRALDGEKAKADMLAVMSHEMRTPLNGILGTLDLMADTRLSERQREYLRIIRGSGEFLLGHVKDVLDISRLDAGKMPVAQLPFDADRLLGDLLESQRPAAEARGNRLMLDRQALPCGWVLGDVTKLRQVLLNLIGNAIKFTRRGDITVAVRRLAAERVEFTVQDTGIGIAAADLGRIFEDFVTIDSSYGRNAEGSGLGLPIVRRLTQAMGGATTVESTEGSGSLFRVVLPLPSTRPADVPPAGGVGAGPVVADRLAVLVVEDNGINRYVVSTMLEGDGHRVDTATTGAEGLRMAQAQHYDLILMDIAMPEMDGIAATRAIRSGPAASADSPIVALTAHALPADLARFAKAGVNDTLLKPLSRDELRALTTRIAMERNGQDVVEVPLVDRPHLLSLRDGLGDAAFAGLFEQFGHETARDLVQLADWTAPPADRLGLVHRLAGSAAVFGAARLHHALSTLEDALRADPDRECAMAIGAAAAIWSATQADYAVALQSTVVVDGAIPSAGQRDRGRHPAQDFCG